MKIAQKHGIRTIRWEAIGSPFRDCHIEPDWLLIYKIDGEDLRLVRTGTHSDQF